MVKNKTVKIMKTKILKLRKKFNEETNENVTYGTKPEPFYSDGYVDWLEKLVIMQENGTNTDYNKFHIQNIICNTCKHWGGQGTIGTVKHTEGDYRPWMAYLFEDMDNQNFKPIPEWKVTYGNLNGAKGVLEVHKDFGCVNHNPDFDLKDQSTTTVAT